MKNATCRTPGSALEYLRGRGCRKIFYVPTVTENSPDAADSMSEMLATGTIPKSRKVPFILIERDSVRKPAGK